MAPRNKERLQLLSLLKGAIWGTKPDPGLFVGADWPAIVKLAQVETVASLIADGIAMLPREVGPSLKEKVPLIASVQTNEAANLKHREFIGRLGSALEEAGVKVAFMKGQVVSVRYPQPLHRQHGDIDFVVGPNDMRACLKVIERLGGKVDWGHIDEKHGHAFIGDILLEPHHKIHNYQRPSTDKRVQGLFAQVFPSQLIEVDLGVAKAKALPPEFESLFLMSHMIHHVYGEGLGLRQVVDYAMFINKQWGSIDVDKHSEWLRHARMMRAWRIMVCICVEFLGTPKPEDIEPFTTKERRWAEKLFDDIMQVGNFGRGSYVFNYDSTLDVLRNYAWVLKRCLRLRFVCPSEARWWPFAKLYWFVWKKLHSGQFHEA